MHKKCACGILGCSCPACMSSLLSAVDRERPTAFVRNSNTADCVRKLPLRKHCTSCAHSLCCFGRESTCGIRVERGLSEMTVTKLCKERVARTSAGSSEVALSSAAEAAANHEASGTIGGESNLDRTAPADSEAPSPTSSCPHCCVTRGPFISDKPRDHSSGTLFFLHLAMREAASSGAVPLRRARVQTSLSIKREPWFVFGDESPFFLRVRRDSVSPPRPPDTVLASCHDCRQFGSWGRTAN
jgi:hypothetical protein